MGSVVRSDPATSLSVPMLSAAGQTIHVGVIDCAYEPVEKNVRATVKMITMGCISTEDEVEMLKDYGWGMLG